MIVERSIKFRRLIPIIWKRILKMFILSSIIVIPLVYFELDQFAIGMTAPLILGTAISIFLGFRTNSAYDRWFEARSLFGDITASTRNLALVLARIDERYINVETGKASKVGAEILPRMIKRGVAYVWILGRQLKDLDPLDFEGVDTLLEKDEIKRLKQAHNPALKALFLQSQDYRKAAKVHQFYEGESFEIVAIQRELSKLQTRSEGLKGTPFPTHYTYFTDLFVWLLVVLLSLSLPANESSGYYAIPLAVLIGWIFSMIEGIGDYMDYPWANNRNVVPMDTLSRNLEIDVRSIALQEKNVLPALKPIDGASY